MKRNRWIQAGLVLLAVATTALPAQAQWDRSRVEATPYESDEPPVEFDKTDMSGPRFGFTYVVGRGDLVDELENNDMGRPLSQFGWHFERRVTPDGGGPQFVVQAVPMLGGVEYGKVVPNLTLAMGIRFPRGWEFGIGPNAILVGSDDSEPVQTSLVTSIGYSFDYGGVSLPVNVALATNPEGSRISLVFGYAIRR